MGDAEPAEPTEIRPGLSEIASKPDSPTSGRGHRTSSPQPPSRNVGNGGGLSRFPLAAADQQTKDGQSEPSRRARFRDRLQPQVVDVKRPLGRSVSGPDIDALVLRRKNQGIHFYDPGTAVDVMASRVFSLRTRVRRLPCAHDTDGFVAAPAGRNGRESLSFLESLAD